MVSGSDLTNQIPEEETMIQTRNTTAISPFERLISLQRELDRTLGGTENMGAAMFNPAMDVIELENEIQARLEVPGIDPGEIEIRVEDNVLTVSGEKRMEEEHADNARGYRLVERRYGRFARSIALPRGVDAARVTADCNDGVLTVHLPKAESSKPRTIKIESGKSPRESTGRELS
jgi:HSP20 family protein